MQMKKVVYGINYGVMWKKGECGNPGTMINPGNANEMREKGLEKRREMKSSREILEGMDEDIVRMFNSSFKDVAQMSVDPDLPVALRLEASEIVNKDRKRGIARLDRVRDRIQGKAKISADVSGDLREQIGLVVSSQEVADAMGKIEGYGEENEG